MTDASPPAWWFEAAALAMPPERVDFAAMERAILAYWREIRAFPRQNERAAARVRGAAAWAGPRAD